MLFIVIIIISIIIGIISVVYKNSNDTSEYISANKEPDFNENLRSEKRILPNGDYVDVNIQKTPVYSSKSSGNGITIEKTLYKTSEDFGGYVPKPYSGLLPAAYYKVKGRNTATNRMKGLKIYAHSETDAKRRAESQGLAEPFTVEYLTDNEPTDRQLEVLKENNITLPTGATRYDVSCILDFAFKEGTPLKQKTIDYVLEHDIVISPYSSEERARCIISNTK